MANTFTLQSVLVKEEAVNSCTSLFMHRLGVFADRDEAVDLGTWLQYYAFDVVGEVTFSLKLGFLEKGQDVDGIMGSIAALLVPYNPSPVLLYLTLMVS